SGVFDWHLVAHALEEPVMITIAVLVAGLLFKWLAGPLEKGVMATVRVLPVRLFLALTVVLLGFLSSVITAMIAALVLVEIVSVLRLDRRSELTAVVLACFS